MSRDVVPVSGTRRRAVLRTADGSVVVRHAALHGDRDPYFPLDHPRMLAEAAGDTADLWLEPGMGHAEHAAADSLLARIAAWGVVQAGDGETAEAVAARPAPHDG